MSKNWAICIGINEYDRLPKLRYAVQDAVAVQDFFLREVGFEKVFYFSDDSPPIETPLGPMPSLPTYTNLTDFFGKRFQKNFLKMEDNLWFFFAGHGELYEGHDYLMPIDVSPGNLEKTALKISEITAILRNSGAGNTVLLLDACRSEELGQGRRSAMGFGSDEQPGMVTIYSCSPGQSSYEIEELQHGAFTHSLLKGFRLQGADSCATVQRIDQYLRHQVPILNQQYQKRPQTPYTAVEPLSKNCLILLPQRARLEDVQALKLEAHNAENKNDWDFAQQLWTRVLATPGVDQDAILGLQRIALKRVQHPPSVGNSSSATAGSRRIDAPVTEPVPQSPPSVQPGYKVERLAQPVTPLNVINAPTPSKEEEDEWDENLHLTLDDEPTAESPTFELEVIKVDASGNVIQREQRKAEYRREDLGQDVTLGLVMIPGGTFQMGSASDKGGADERPQHQVAVKPFLMGKYSVTQEQWRVVSTFPKVGRDLRSAPSKFSGDNRPVEQVSWDDAEEFCKRLSKHTKREYRLPSEAEWEYACRAGTITAFHFGEKLTPRLAQCKANLGMVYLSLFFSGQTAPVSSFSANAFGLYDMHGNVCEWCLDHWHGNYEGAPTDGSAWLSADKSAYRLLRGGCWNFDPDHCRSAYRNRNTRHARYNSIGFRVVSGLLVDS